MAKLRKHLALSALVVTAACGGRVSDPTAGLDPTTGASSPATDGGASDPAIDASVCTDTMSSSAHCGRCGHDCLGGACIQGSCQPVELTEGQVNPDNLVVDDTSIAWVEDAEGTIRSMSKAGGPTTLLLAHDWPRALAVDATTLYYTWENGSGAEIFAMPKRGGASKSLVKTRAYAIAIDDANVYWANRYDGEIGRVPKAGGAARIVAEGRKSPTSIVVANGRVCWVETGAVASRNGSVVCDGVALASGLLTPAGLAFDGEALFFTIGGGESVASVGLTGGGVRIVASGVPSRPTDSPFVKAIAVDARSVYWISTGDPERGSPSRLLRALKTGTGAIETVSIDYVRSVVTDDRALYWAEDLSLWRRAL